MKVLEKNCYKLKTRKITAMKVLKTLLFHAMLSWIKTPTRKKRYVKGNQSLFMNKTLSEAVKQRIKLRNLFPKNRTEENRNNYVKQRKLCVTFLPKSKREIFGSLTRQTCEIIRKFGVWLSFHYQIKLLLMKKPFW